MASARVAKCVSELPSTLFYGLNHGSAAPKSARGARGVLGEIREVCGRCSRLRVSTIFGTEVPRGLCTV